MNYVYLPLRDLIAVCIFYAFASVFPFSANACSLFGEDRVLPSIQFVLEKPPKPLSVRFEQFEDLVEFETHFEIFRREGFLSRARKQLSSQEWAGIESRLVRDVDFFYEKAFSQKVDDGPHRKGATASFIAPFVETSQDLGWVARVAEGVKYRKDAQFLWAVVKSKRGVTVDVLPKHGGSDDEGGVLFIGGISKSEISRFVVLKVSSGTQDWSEYTPDSKGWKKQTLEHGFTDFQKIMNDALGDAVSPNQRHMIRKMVDQGQWLRPGSWEE